jgi:hypothetical protein
MINFSQTLEKLSRFLKATPRHDRKIARGRTLNCCSAEFYDRSQRSALRVRSTKQKASSPAQDSQLTANFTAANAISALLKALNLLGGTLQTSPGKPNTIVTVSLPWEANDASTSATGS